MQKLIYVVPGGSLDSPDDTVVITSERGTTTNYIINSPRGLGAVNTRLTTTTPVGLHGTVFHSVELEAREVSDTIHIQTTGNRQSLYKLRTDLESKLNPLRGMGTLYYANDYGMWKIQAIPKVYGEAEGRVGLRHSRANVSFYCPDPFWQDIAPTTVRLFTANMGDDYPVTFPVMLDRSERIETVLVGSAEEANTVVQVTGPVENFRLINMTTGAEIDIKVKIPVGWTLTIDSIEKEAILSDGTTSKVVIPEFGDESIVLARGINRLMCYFDWYSSGATVSMTYTRRFVGV